MSIRIMVVGGYGAVGRTISRELAASPEVEVIVAGRRLEPAEVLAAQLQASARRIDINEPAEWRNAFRDVDAVVMCMDQRDTSLVSFLLDAGIHYIDITATDGFFRDIESLRPRSPAAALLSVGLAPGLTNLLALHAASGLDHLDSIDIGLLQGLGDSHGPAAVTWVADMLFNPERTRGSMLVDFGRAGRRRAHPIDFSDQHTLMRTLPVGAATTRVSFDSRLSTAAFFGLANLAPRSRTARNAIVWLSEHLRFGSDIFDIATTASGSRGGKPAQVTARFHGRGESETTGRLSALMTLKFLQQGPAPGIWHSHQVLDPATLLDEIEHEGIGRVEVAGSASIRSPDRSRFPSQTVTLEHGDVS